jgi:acetyl esterase/lipase
VMSPRQGGLAGPELTSGSWTRRRGAIRGGDMGRLLRSVLTVWAATILVGGAILAQDTKPGAASAEAGPGATGRVIPIWPGVAPGSEGWTQKEVEFRGLDGKRMVRNVTTPALTAFLPDAKAATGAAVVVCPGGGFRFLSWDSEGTEVAEWLRKRGVAAFVLRYRTKETAASEDAFGKEMTAFFGTLIRFKDRGSSDGWKALAKDMRESGAAGIADGRQAVKVVRRRAKEWGIKPDRVGIMGFSAGGIITTAVVMDHEAESRPDFAASIYAPFFGDATVPADAPPLFILCAADDRIAEAGCVRLYSAWRDAGRPAEMHIYETGGHGFGMTPKGQPVDHWVERFGDWLGQRKIISRFNSAGSNARKARL